MTQLGTLLNDRARHMRLGIKNAVARASCEVSANAKAVYLNGWFWIEHDFSDRGIDAKQKAIVLDGLRQT